MELGSSNREFLLYAVYLPCLVLILMISEKSVLHLNIPIGEIHPTSLCEHMVTGRKEAKRAVHGEHREISRGG